MRSILIFPEIYNEQALQKVRQQYDPLFSHIRPHISLVFPFDATASDTNIIETTQQILTTTKSFPTTFNKLGSDNNGYIWIEPSYGKDKFVKIHDNLYQNSLFPPFLRKDIPFEPHITLGKVEPKIQAEILASLSVEELSFSTYIDSITIENILPNQDSEVLAQIDLK